MRVGPTAFVGVAAIAIAVTTRAQAEMLESVPALPWDWRPVAYNDLRLPGAVTKVHADIWADAIAKNNDAYRRAGDTRYAVGNAPTTESNVVIRSPSKTVVLSVLNTVSGCKVIAADRGLATLKFCPMRIATFEANRNGISDLGVGCFIEYTPAPPNTTIDPNRNVALASYDTATKTIRLGAKFGNRFVDRCQANVSVP